MSLPYPYEVETGELKPGRRSPPRPLDVAQHVNDAIQVHGTELEVFGVPLDVEPPDSARVIATELRRAVTEHFQERVAAPDDDTWASFANQAHDQLDGRTAVDASTLRVLRLTIDSL